MVSWNTIYRCHGKLFNEMLYKKDLLKTFLCDIMCLIKNTKVEVAEDKSKLVELDKALKSIERGICRNKNSSKFLLGI